MAKHDEFNLNVDFSLTEEIVCEKCGNATFTQIVYLRKVPATISPSGEPAYLPIPAFECSACGHVNSDFVPNIDAMNE